MQRNVFTVCLLETKSGWTKKWLNQLRRDTRFRTKKIENVYVCNEHLTEDCYEVSYRYEMLGAKTRKRRLKHDAAPKILKAMHFKRAPDGAERTRRGQCNLQFSPATFSYIINAPLKFIWENNNCCFWDKNVIKGKGEIKERK